MRACTLIFLFNLSFFPSFALAHEWEAARPDGHAPISIMGDHIHEKGEWMVSYRHRHMDMDGMRKDTNEISVQDVLSDFMVSPLSMRMDMHMVGVMYAPTDQWTLSGMLPYIEKKMDHRTRMGARFTTRSSGLGDVRLTGLFRLWEREGHRIHLNAGMSFPTGSIDETDDTAMAANAKLPYPMQLGSGTFDLLPGLTYLGQRGRLSWGAQVAGTVRLGQNDNKYSLGDRLEGNTWGAFKWCDWVSTSIRLGASMWDDIEGFDPDLNPAMAPTADPNRQGGWRVDVGLGLNFFVPEGALKGHRLATEFAVPIYQNLEGPQMETDWTLTSGWQFAW